MKLAIDNNWKSRHLATKKIVYTYTLLNRMCCLQAFVLIICFPFVSRIHYRLYYALYLYENSFSSSGGELAAAVEGKTGQQSLLKYGYVEENIGNDKCHDCGEVETIPHVYCRIGN